MIYNVDDRRQYMLKVFNTDALTKNQRFNQALLYGIPSALVLGIGFGIISSMIHIEFSIMYVLFGYLIGLVIQKKGRGVQTKFSVLAAILAFVCFFLGDLVSNFGLSIIWTPGLWGTAASMLLRFYTSISFNTLLGILFRVFGIYYAYINARVV